MSIDNKDKILNVPNLRFPGFGGEWKTLFVDDVCPEFQSGKNIKAENIKSEGLYPVYGGNGLRGYTDIYNHDGTYVLIGRQGALCGNVRLVEGRNYITEHAIAVSSSNEHCIYFLYYLFYKMNLGQYSDQSAQPGLAVNKLLRLKLHIPLKDEQTKIAKILTLLDTRIATQNKIIEDLKKLKVAIIENVFKAKCCNHKIGDIITQVSIRNKSNNVPNVLSVSNKQGFVEQSEQFEDRTVASEDVTNYKIVRTNDFAYNPARINVGSIARLKQHESGIVSPMYICFHTKKDVLPEYLEIFFHTQSFKHEMYKRLEGSVRLCLSYEGLTNIPIFIPGIPAQLEISKRIFVFERKIATEECYLNALEQQKQYLLQQMFI